MVLRPSLSSGISNGIVSVSANATVFLLVISIRPAALGHVDCVLENANAVPGGRDSLLVATFCLSVRGVDGARAIVVTDVVPFPIDDKDRDEHQCGDHQDPQNCEATNVENVVASTVFFSSIRLTHHNNNDCYCLQ